MKLTCGLCKPVALRPKEQALTTQNRRALLDQPDLSQAALGSIEDSARWFGINCSSKKLPWRAARLITCAGCEWVFLG